MSSNDDIRAMFFEECRDLIEALLEGLTLLEEGVPEQDTVNAIFRSVHSIKGGAGAFQLDELVAFSHKFETVLDTLRSGKIEHSPPLIQTMLRAADHLAHLVETSQDGSDINSDRRLALLKELDAYVLLDDEMDDGFTFEALTLDFGPIDIPISAEETIEVEFQPFAKLYQNGHDPLLLIDALSLRGTLSADIDHQVLTSFDSFDVASPSLVFKLRFTAEDPEAIVEDVFEFVDGICRLDIQRISDDAIGGLKPDVQILNEDAFETATVLTVDEIPQTNDAEETGTVTAAPRKEAVAVQPTLRVELDKIDRLINTVGELIINQAMIAQRIDQLDLPNDDELDSDMADYKILARDLQEGVMAIRAQPVKPLFQRMARIAREAGDATGKAVHLSMMGENTEVDKTVIERLADPLTHMIRNAIDHGLENRETRIEAGKPETGKILLSASHKSGNVMIDVSEDGAGLNRERILNIAITKGLVPQDSNLTDPEIDKLLFLPGFSTNSEVSELSGRGVGMDVVKTAVEALGGRVSISSVPGKGTRFSIVLPLTLAVMDGIVISVAGETMIVPITAVVETLRPEQSDIFPLGSDQDLLLIRGEYVPIVSIRQSLGLGSAESEPERKVLVLIESLDGKRCALCVDAIHDQRQVVIKSVGGNYGRIPGVSAATIMGNGKIALILDTDYLSKDIIDTSTIQEPFSQELRNRHD